MQEYEEYESEEQYENEEQYEDDDYSYEDRYEPEEESVKYEYDAFGNIIDDDEEEEEDESTLGEDEEELPPDDEEQTDELDEDIVHEVPPFIPDNLIPTEFKTMHEELSWYRENLPKLYDLFGSDNFKENLLKTYEDSLLSKEKEIEQLKAVKSALEGDPELAFKMYMPNVLQAKGIKPVFNNEEIDRYVQSRLKEEFGEEYIDLIEPNEVFRPSSLTNQIYSRQQQLLQEAIEHNNTYNQSTPTTDPAAVREMLVAQKAQYFQDYSDEEYEEMVSNIDRYEWDLLDYHHALHFADYMEEQYDTGYEEGYESGRQAVLKEIKSAGSNQHVFENDIDIKHYQPTDEIDYLRSMNVQLT